MIDTKNAGANAERTAILAHVRKLNRKYENSVPEDALLKLIEWLLLRNERYNAKAGGLGKKTA